jgi:hypothetical protein
MPVAGTGEETSQVERTVAMSSEGLIIRSTKGVCRGPAPETSISTDLGETWSIASFGDLPVAEILDAGVVGATEIDLVVALAPDCTPTVITSSTSGQSWYSSQDLLAEKVYVTSTDSSDIQFLGAVLQSPCSRLTEIEQVASGVVAQCAEGLYAYDKAPGAWRLLTASPVVAFGADEQSTTVVAALDGSDACAGVGMRVFDLAETPAGEVPGTCITRDVATPGSVVALAGSDAVLWSSSDFLKSADGGVTWASTLR